jgi:hypothetical protein
MGQIAEEIFVQLVAGLGSNPTQSQLEAAATEALEAEAAYQLVQSRKSRGG